MTIVKLLRRVGGGTPELDHDDVSQKTRNGYTVLGGLMLILAIMSASIAGFTWASVMHSPMVGVCVTIGWFFFSLALNYMMAWIIDASRSTKRGGIAVALTTILLFGALISAVNTNFVMLWMLDTEIRQGIQADYQAERANKERDIVRLDAKHADDLGRARLAAGLAIQKASGDGGDEIAKLQAEAAALQADYRTALAAITTEVDGRANSKQVGEGPRARTKRLEAEQRKALYDAAAARLAEATAKRGPTVEAKVVQIEATLATEERALADRHAEVKTRLQRDIQELDLLPRDGFINRDKVMWGLLGKNQHFMIIFVAFFFLLECLVGLVKVLMGKTDYHVLLESMASDKLKALNDKIKLNRDAIRANELATISGDLEHRNALRDARLKDEAGRLSAAAQYQQHLEDHLTSLRTSGMKQEDVLVERERLLKQARKNGFLKVVSSR